MPKFRYVKSRLKSIFKDLVPLSVYCQMSFITFQRGLANIKICSVALSSQMKHVSDPGTFADPEILFLVLCLRDFERENFLILEGLWKSCCRGK